MTPKYWRLVDDETAERMKNMIAAAMLFRELHDHPPAGQEPGAYYQDLAEALREVAIHEVWFTELVGKKKTQGHVRKVIDWMHKRELELSKYGVMITLVFLGRGRPQ